MEIVGVDFSGARLDNNTWLAEGVLDEQGLTLRRCRPVGRLALAELLAALPGTSVAALDFPFSVPLAFARRWVLSRGVRNRTSSTASPTPARVARTMTIKSWGAKMPATGSEVPAVAWNRRRQPGGAASSMDERR